MPIEIDNHLDFETPEACYSTEPNTSLLRSGHGEKHKPKVNTTRQTTQTEEYPYIEEETDDGNPESEDSPQQETYIPEYLNTDTPSQNSNSKSSFSDGAAVGLGIGIIVCSAMLWAFLFLAPLLPQSATYENLLATYVYLLVPLLSLGLVALTAGVVREYYSKHSRP